MKYISFLMIACYSLLAISCNKQDFCPADTTQAPPSEIAQVEAYLVSEGITAIKDDRGFFYTVRTSGSGKNPTICSTVTVNYKGQLTNGVEFDASNGASFRLNGLITGWKQAIPLMTPGGSIRLYLPPSLGYGVAGSPPSIPANAILIFDIDLVAVN